jgi:protein MpaA
MNKPALDFASPRSPFDPLQTLAAEPARPVPPKRRSIKELLLPLFLHCGASTQNLRADSAGFWDHHGTRHWLPRLIFRGGPSEEPPLRLGIFAGIHGDEPEGVFALLDFLQFLEANPEIGRSYHLSIYPLCNPTGYEDNTRHSRRGKDLNREFWRASDEPEVNILERELIRGNFHGILSLHSDDTSDGLYGFVRGATLTEHLLKPALAAAQAALPVNGAPMIDGFHAVNGIIHTAYEGILTAPPGTTPAPMEIILESPHLAPGQLQRQAFVLALTEILRQYRQMIAYGGDL